MPLSIVLYQPDIAGNAGTLLRLGACLEVPVEIVEPTGFDLSDRALRRAGLDYWEKARLVRHLDFRRFDEERRRAARRLILLTTRGDTDYRDFAFRDDDALLFGRESAGVPDDVHANADRRLFIQMAPDTRSLNLAVSTAMVVGEALRQQRERTRPPVGPAPRLGTGVAVLREGGDLLLLRRLTDPEHGCWGLPGGKVDPFERAEEAARREVSEELGIDVAIEQFLVNVDQIDRPAGTHWFAPIFLARTYEGTPRILEPHKHDGLGWFALDALPEPLTAAAREAAAALLRRR